MYILGSYVVPFCICFWSSCTLRNILVNAKMFVCLNCFYCISLLSLLSVFHFVEKSKILVNILDYPTNWKDFIHATLTTSIFKVSKMEHKWFSSFTRMQWNILLWLSVKIRIMNYRQKYWQVYIDNKTLQVSLYRA